MAEAASTTGLQDVVNALNDSFKKLTEQMNQLGSSLQRLATAGFQATTEGNRLSFVWMLFTRQIAAVALPVVNFLIEKITALTDWFRNLSGNGQDLLLKIGGIVVIFTTVVAAVSALSMVLSPVALVIGAVVTALYVFFTETALGQAAIDKVTESIKWMISRWQDVIDVFDKVKFFIGVAIDSVLSVVTGFVAGVAGIVAEIASWIPGLGGTAEAVEKFAQSAKKASEDFYESANKAFVPRERKPDDGGKGKGRRDVNPTGFGFESLAASYERITSAANKTDLARETLEVQKKQLEQQIAMVAGIGGIQSGAKELRGDH